MLLDREQMIKKRLALEEETFLSYSKRIASYLEEMPAFKNAKRIGFYMSYRHEVDTLHLIEKYILEKEIYVPKCVGDELDFQRIYTMDDLKKGAFHILEPSTNEHMDVKDLDVIVVPLLMFDANHNRIGYGRGFYDRCLKKTNALTVGLAFDFQKVENTHPHSLDVPLNHIITQKGVF